MSEQRDLSRLPKWAQQEIAALQRQLAEAQRRADQARLDSGPADSNTLIDPYDDVPIRLGVDVPVRFILQATDTRRLNDHWVEVRVHENGLQLMAGRQLVFVPRVTNVTRVEVRDR